MNWIFADKVHIILISGKAGVGKTTLANFMLEEFNRKNLPILVVKESFASMVKHVAYTCFGWNGVKDKKGRKLLQHIGNTGREYYQDIWIDKMLSSSAIIPNIIIIDDWRFPNELEYFKKMSDNYEVFTVRIEAENREILKGTNEYFDESERSLPSGFYQLSIYDKVIDNSNLSKEDLNRKAKELVDLLILMEGEKDE